MHNPGKLLSLFNNFTFGHAAQSLLSSLTPSELKALLQAVANMEEYQQLTQLIRGRLFVCVCQQVDRTYYYIHYENTNLTLMKEERANNVANMLSAQCLDQLLSEYDGIIRKGQLMLGEEFEEVRSAVFEPTLQLPPMVRQTMAPECKTVFQVKLACGSQQTDMEEQPLFPQDKSTTSLFFQCLKVHINFANAYLSCLSEDYEHFTEINFRFMVYRNAVLALHQLSPFPSLSQPLQMWNQLMSHHYSRSHQIFLRLLNLGAYNSTAGLGLLSGQELKQEGYMVDYVESLVDQSIDEQTVAFCGHSKNNFGGQYGVLEKELFASLHQHCIKNNTTPNDLKAKLEELAEAGLRQSTLRKVGECFGQLKESQVLSNMCCSADAFIENCARINGSKRTDLIDLNVLCF